ncbi:hypothetical protein [Nemorincola caseinilytica]
MLLYKVGVGNALHYGQQLGSIGRKFGLLQYHIGIAEGVGSV